MRKTDRFKMEKNIRKATHVEDPRKEFVGTLRQRITGQDSPITGCLRFQNLSHRPVWFFLVIGFVLISVVYFSIGPKNVHAFIEDFNSLDPGMETVEEAGMVTELEITSQFTIQDIDNSTQVITVILDWVYLDEGRLVLGVITEAVPSGLALDMPTITTEQSIKQNLAFSSISEEGNDNQIIFMAFNPIQMDNNDKQVDFSVDIPLIESADLDKTPLVVFHYDLEGIPVRRGISYEFEQSAPVLVDDLEFQLDFIQTTPSFTKVTFSVNLSAEDILALPKSDINLQIGDSPIIYDYFLLGITESEDLTCVQIGFLDGGLLGNERIIFRFKQNFIAIVESISTFSPNERKDRTFPKP